MPEELLPACWLVALRVLCMTITLLGVQEGSVLQGQERILLVFVLVLKPGSSIVYCKGCQSVWYAVGWMVLQCRVFCSSAGSRV